MHLYDTEDTHTVVWPSPPSIHRFLFIWQHQPSTCWTAPPILSYLQPLATPFHFLVMNLTILGTSCKWNHTLSFSWLAYFPLAWCPQGSSMSWHVSEFSSFWDWILFNCVDILHFVSPFNHQWALGLPPLFGYFE